jgi:hypothetical protein
MFCPLCKTEYREGFYTCADCSVPLVAELQKEEKSESDTNEIEYIEALSTRNPAELALIKSIFEAEDIAYYVLGEQMMTSPMLSGGGSARLFVATLDIDLAKEILKDVEFEEPDFLLGILRKF